MRLHVLRVMHANSQTETDEIPEGWGRIYAMSDPRNPALPRYIGQTRKTLRHRLMLHREDSSKRNRSSLVNAWIRELRSEGLVPVIYQLEVAQAEKLFERENHWIVFFRPLG